MIRKILCLLIPLLQIAVITFSQIPIGIGQWRSHVPYHNPTSVAVAADRVYLSSNVFFYSYDKTTGEVQRFDKVSGLSDVGVSLVSYNPFNYTLLVVYENANIDMIRQNTIINISDIKRKQMVGEKTIYSAYFIGHLAYLSCSFGIIVLDTEKREIKDTYRIGSNGADKKVFSFTADSLNFYAATEEGLKMAPRNSPNLSNYNEWSLAQGLPAAQSQNVAELNGQIFAEVKDTLYTLANDSWSYYYSRPSWSIENINVSNDYMTVCEKREDSTSTSVRFFVVASDFVCCDTSYFSSQIIEPRQVYVDSDNTIWIADFLQGLVKIENGTIYPPVVPTGVPNSASVQSMSAKNGVVWMAPGGGGPTVPNTYNREGVFSFIYNWWNVYNQYNHPEISNFLSVYETVVHPSLDIVYFGSWFSGLAEFNGNSFTVYDKNNSILDPSEDGVTTIISGLAFDSEENLWIASFSADNPVNVKRKDGTWQKYSVQGVEGNWLTQMIVDEYDQKWAVISKSNNQGILVFKENPEMSSSGNYKILRTGTGNGNLPTNDVLCLAKDHEGEIWVGTAQGIAVFYCSYSVLSEQGCEAQQIIVTQSGVAGYLLETERVRTIAVDGANRKWAGTSNGVFLLSAEGTEEIAHYTVDNSPLLSNEIINIAVDHEAGEVFIGTSKGIVSVRGEATLTEEEHSTVMVFPNPVRENYDGPIAINGLANQANVKITDVTGMLFFETTAFGGQAVWNGRNYNGERAKTGVYLVFTSNEDGSSTHVTKLLIIN